MNPSGQIISVQLSRGLSALVSEEDYPRVRRYKWSAQWNRWGYYAARVERGKCIYLHRFIMGAGPGQKVDHKNGDRLDCTRGNLRLATTAQNNRNRRVSHGRQFKGVDEHHGRWRARIKLDRIQISLGHFDTPEAAARAYDAKAVELHGEFARLNFPGTEEHAAA